MSFTADQIAARTSQVARMLLLRHLKAQQSELELTINATQTGEVRNNLCDANIHLMEAIVHLTKAVTKGEASHV